jgi:choline transport protein
VPGAIVYAIAISWGLFTAVMFCFPATKHVDSSTLNFTAPVIGVGMAIATINWFAYSRKVYHGDRTLRKQLSFSESVSA